MLEFAAYLIGKDGHIVNRVDLPCADESEARTKAAYLAVKFDVELSERARRIETFLCRLERETRKVDAREVIRWLSGLFV